MGTSKNVFDERVKDFLDEHKPKIVLDVGSGDGKYGKMTKVISLDPDGGDIQKTAQEFMEEPNFYCDVCIMGDVIEHMKKSEGIDFIEWMIYRCKYLIIVTPKWYMQVGHKGKYDAHISSWQKCDFDPYWIEWYEEKEMVILAIIEGLWANGKFKKEDFYEKDSGAY
jgi:hypothetical protein